MTYSLKETENLFFNECFPRSNRYDSDWIAKNQMGPNALWLSEWLMEDLKLSSGMRVLDMGCGRAISSVFMAKEYGVTVFATDLWVSAGDNWVRVQEAQLENQVFPIHAEAHSLPFAENFFDAIVSFDSYSYYGTDDLYLSYIIRFLKPGGKIGIVVPGLQSEFINTPPEYLLKPQRNGRVFWEPDCYTFHSAQWWRRHWEKSGSVKVEIADTMVDGWKHWAQHERAVEASGYAIFPSDEETLLEDAGRNLSLVRIIGHRNREDNPLIRKGADPHVWEPAFMNICDKLMSLRNKK
jgi:SAM-dependent methyltransferase